MFSELGEREDSTFNTPPVNPRQLLFSSENLSRGAQPPDSTPDAGEETLHFLLSHQIRAEVRISSFGFSLHSEHDSGILTFRGCPPFSGGA